MNGQFAWVTEPEKPAKVPTIVLYPNLLKRRLDIEVMKEFSHYVGLILLMCYDVCIFSHLIIALNRLSAVVFPMSYSVHFSNRNPTILIIAIWTISIIVPCALHGRNDQVKQSRDEQKLGQNSFKTGEMISRFIWLLKIYGVLKGMKAPWKQLKTVVQGVMFTVGLGMYFFLGWLFANKWVIWSLTTVAWNSLHLSDAIIIISFNKEFRRLIGSPFSRLRASCTKKSMVYTAQSAIAPEVQDIAQPNTPLQAVTAAVDPQRPEAKKSRGHRLQKFEFGSFVPSDLSKRVHSMTFYGQRFGILHAGISKGTRVPIQRVYAPTADSENEEHDYFHEKLNF
ncbi:hypothetical protein TELCIR_07969 [Teladorsagia circumcincta]|uniref:7TM GPCR serpentine receptor class x (Srx) domain-containing protein n=1 Tax=Teladorsagia circumcincta TaxID=45464 RepID=A0A2G9UIW9_TELCI|nr:hypothetical protein TELCIR_07969 [Teladorsagia circumcincta]